MIEKAPGKALPYISHIGVCAAGRVFAPFWSEIGYTLCPFLAGIGYGFRAYRGLYEPSTYFQFQVSEKEREICEFEMDLNNFLFAL